MIWLYLYKLFGILLLERYRMTNYFWVNTYINAKQKYLSNIRCYRAKGCYLSGVITNE